MTWLKLFGIDKEKQQKELENVKKLTELVYLSGNWVYEEITAMQTMAHISLSFPGYGSFIYDGRFFGLASSEILSKIMKTRRSGYLNGYFITGKYRPVQTAMKLSEAGEKLAEKSLDDYRKLVGSDKLKELAGEVLSMTNISLPISTAWSLYMSDIDSKHPSENEITHPDIGRPANYTGYYGEEPKGIGEKFSDQSMNLLFEKFRTKYNWLIEKFAHNYRRLDGLHRFSFVIRPEGVKERYEYLTANEEYIENKLAEFENAKSSEDRRSLLVKYSGEKNDSPDINWVPFLDRLLKKYGNSIADYYVDSVVEKLQKIKSRMDNLERSYGKIFDGTLGNLSDASREFFDDSNRKVIVKFWKLPKDYILRDRPVMYTEPEVHEEIQKRVEKQIGTKWNFGTNAHILHLAQIIERLYLLEKGDVEEVDNSLERRI